MCVHSQLLQSCPIFVTLWAIAFQASLFVGFSRQEYWSGFPFPPPGDLPGPGMEPRSPALQADSFLSEPIKYVLCAQFCLTLCDPMDCSPPGSSVHGILQARMLEWVAMPSSRGSSRPRGQARVSYGLLHWQAGVFTTSATWKLILKSGKKQK